jgi:hypothetical protein
MGLAGLKGQPAHAEHLAIGIQPFQPHFGRV